MNRVAHSSDKTKGHNWRTNKGERSSVLDSPFWEREHCSSCNEQFRRYLSMGTSTNSTRIPATSTSHISTLVGFGSAKSGPRKCLTVDTFCTVFYRRSRSQGQTRGENGRQRQKAKKKKKAVKRSFCVFGFAKGNRGSAQTKYLSGS